MTLLALVVTADLSLDHCTPNGSLNISGTDTWQKSLGVQMLCTSPLDVTVYCQPQSNPAATAGETGHFCRWWQEYVSKLVVSAVGWLATLSSALSWRNLPFWIGQDNSVREQLRQIQSYYFFCVSEIQFTFLIMLLCFSDDPTKIMIWKVRV